MEKNQFICPNCATTIDIELQLTERISKKFSEKELDLIQREKNLNSTLKAKEITLKESMLQQAKLELNDELLLWKQKKQQEIDNLLLEKQKAQTLSIANDDLQRKLQNAKADAEIQVRKELFEKIQKENSIYLKQQQELIDLNYQQKLREYELKLTEANDRERQLKDQTKAMQQKLEQGSMQSQGEALELHIEKLLKENFPFDIIDNVNKGKRGADLVLVIRNSSQQTSGKIIIECKNTKTWSNDWIPKLKSDGLLVNADCLILISQVLPNAKNFEKAGIIDDVWVCGVVEFIPLLTALRQGVLNTYHALNSQTNKGEKQNRLYDYFISNEFKMQIKSIIETHNYQRELIIKERNFWERNWKEREKQLDNMLQNTNHILGSLQGIMGSRMLDKDNEINFLEI